MTTDITELAQSLKAAAERAIGANERLSVYKNDEIIDISQHEGEQIDIDIADINLFLGEANPANILTLVEALEKAQQVDEELCNLLPPGVEYMDPPDGGDVTPLEGVRRMVADYRQRIAELKSRTVTFKLPSTPEPSAFAPWVAKAFYQFHKDTVKSCVAVFSDACRAAGIKVEVE
ncbi:ead/Ea22-like family protein [Klebsiella pneumoniae]|uniref:ead/Ea22-like family protein n=1 Tax=Klebsiella pneumoniae TaxID=573 RepID=UPI000E2BC1FC|nr:ead/Ea22-like family protein [Klebsiella pneumoniae]SVJ86155.1 phage EaA protein [Klebsiella pneumoniae]